MTPGFASKSFMFTSIKEVEWLYHALNIVNAGLTFSITFKMMEAIFSRSSKAEEKINTIDLNIFENTAIFLTSLICYYLGIFGYKGLYTIFSIDYAPYTKSHLIHYFSWFVPCGVLFFLVRNKFQKIHSNNFRNP